MRFMRLFVAIFLPKTILDHLAFHEKFHTELPSLRWIPPESLHITLKFLGNVQPHQVDGIRSVLSTVAAGHSAFDLRLENGGAFPSLKNPRVFWTGISGGMDVLGKMAKRMESSLEGLGFAAENRKFRPHVTLAKPRGERSSVNEGALFCKLFEPYQSPMFHVDFIHLTESRLGPTGSRYEILQSFPLGTSS